MEKKQLIIVGIDVPEAIITKAKTEYPDHEVIVISSIEECLKQQAQFGSEPIPFTRPNLEDLVIPYVPSIKEMKFNNPWPSHHHSSKRNRKY
jgi:hypothetical protein